MAKDPYMQDSAYCLKNKLGIRNQDELNEAETALSALRSLEVDQYTNGKGFGCDRLKAIHECLFQDVYDWAGELREVDSYKLSNSEKGKTTSNTFFLSPDRIEPVVDRVNSFLENKNFLKDCNTDFEFSRNMAQVFNHINTAHPFKEGNGRTARIFMQDVACESGRSLDWSRVSKNEWNEASKTAFNGDLKSLTKVFEKVTVNNAPNVSFEMSEDDYQNNMGVASNYMDYLDRVNENAFRESISDSPGADPGNVVEGDQKKKRDRGYEDHGFGLGG